MAQLLLMTETLNWKATQEEYSHSAGHGDGWLCFVGLRLMREGERAGQVFEIAVCKVPNPPFFPFRFEVRSGGGGSVPYIHSLVNDFGGNVCTCGITCDSPAKTF